MVEVAYPATKREFDPNAGHLELADLYHHIGLEKEAVEEVELALKEYPNNDRIKESYVVHYLQSARPDEGWKRTKDSTIVASTSDITWIREW